MALNEPWSIKSRAHACSITEKKFVDGESFYTALFPDPESSGYLRKDFSQDAWEKRAEDAESPFSFWGSVYQAPVQEEAVEVTAESPEDLLRRLVEEDEEHTENARYILAVMLERKKLLVEADSQPTPTGIIRIYEHRKTGDVFIVKDPNIPLSEIENVQQEVSELLENGGKKKEPEEEVPAEESDSETTEPTEAETQEPDQTEDGDNSDTPDPEPSDTEESESADDEQASNLESETPENLK